jgi:hypothetical protein
MASSFTSGHFRFQVAGSDWESDQAHGFPEDLLDDYFDDRLSHGGRLPDLGSAPVASWLLARLAFLTEDGLGLADAEDVDGGGYVVEFVVYRLPAQPLNPKPGSVQRPLFEDYELDRFIEPERPVASFQLQGYTEGVGVIGQRSPDCPVEGVLEALAAALLAAPSTLRSRELAVRDPEWKLDPKMYRPFPDEDTCNWYGWDGSQFLGKDNIREAK